jgi:diphthine-ammonia ligase
LRIKGAILESKSAKPLSASMPTLLTDQYKVVQNAILSSQAGSRTAELPSVDQQTLTFNHSTTATMATSSLRRNGWVAISNLQANGSPSESDMTLEEEVTKCFQILTGKSNNFIHDFKSSFS